MKSNNILITGATGFIGRHLLVELSQNNHRLLTIARNELPSISDKTKIQHKTLDLTNENTISSLDLSDIDVIIHLASKAHVSDVRSANKLSTFEPLNIAASKHLARQAKQYGVHQFIYLSSIGVHGKSSSQSITEETPFYPQTTYAESKLQAEHIIKNELKGSVTALTIIRPPLVYSVDAPGNFARLVKLANTSLPLPLAKATAPKHLISIDNLVDFIIAVIGNIKTFNQTYVVADDSAVSTADIIRKLRLGMNRSELLIPVPIAILKNVGRLIGKQDIIDQLTTPLEIDTSKAKNQLNWRPKKHASEVMVEIGAMYTNTATR